MRAPHEQDAARSCPRAVAGDLPQHLRCDYRRRLLALSKATMVIGDNATGKTQLNDWLSGIANPARWSRWVPRPEPLRPSEFAIEYFDPEPHRLVAQIHQDRVALTLDGKDHLPVPLPFGVVRLDPSGYRSSNEALVELSRVLSEPIETVAACAERRHGLVGAVRRLGRTDLEVEIGERFGQPERFVPFRLLGSGEQTLVALEAAVSIAQVRATHQLTVLVLDDSLAMLSEDAYSMAINFLSDPLLEFQVLLLQTGAGRSIGRSGWNVAELLRTGSVVEIRQDVPG